MAPRVPRVRRNNQADEKPNIEHTFYPQRRRQSGSLSRMYECLWFGRVVERFEGERPMDRSIDFFLWKMYKWMANGEWLMDPPTEIRGGADLIAATRKKSELLIVEFRIETQHRPRHLRQNSEEDDDVRSPINFPLEFDLSSCLARPTGYHYSTCCHRPGKENGPRGHRAVQSGAERAGRETREERRGEERRGGERITNRPSGGEFFGLSLCLPVDRPTDRSTKAKAEKQRSRVR